jgi:hypothetical protein
MFEDNLINSVSTPGANNYIYKFAYRYDNKIERIVTCSSGLLYLRYAEAVNRAGKPNLAFAVLKYGLNALNILNSTIVPASEKAPMENYMNFSDSRFVNNIGMHARGCGFVETAAGYKIPAGLDSTQTITYVEDAIVDELALETAFEGNRFHDLMRVALRRNDKAFLANKVAEKYTLNKAAIKAKLMDDANWYLPLN